MIETMVPDRLVWTEVSVGNGQGMKPFPFKKVYIQADEGMARYLFNLRFERLDFRDSQTSCRCCGPDFLFCEMDTTLQRATMYQRGAQIWDDGTESSWHWSDDDNYERLTEYCLRDDVLVIYTRERGEEF